MSAQRPRRLVVYAGSFEPVTIGHLWIIEEGARLLERVIVALGFNPQKKHTFSVENPSALSVATLELFGTKRKE